MVTDAHTGQHLVQQAIGIRRDLYWTAAGSTDNVMVTIEAEFADHICAEKFEQKVKNLLTLGWGEEPDERMIAHEGDTLILRYSTYASLPSTRERCIISEHLAERNIHVRFVVANEIGVVVHPVHVLSDERSIAEQLGLSADQSVLGIEE